MTKKELIEKVGYGIVFYICDENYREIADDEIGEINEYIDYKKAIIKAYELSKKNKKIYGISGAFAEIFFNNGKIKEK